MKPVERLDPLPAWIKAPSVRRVLRACIAGGKPARFVGGAVRDAVLGRPVGDIDIATPEPPERVIKLLETDGIRVVATGLKHGTVTAVADGRAVEITTLRRDVETFGRHATVAYTDDWEADAARRDFTMNALYADPDGTLYDPMGGLEDARAGRVRFVGDPETRIAEDYLRLLRCFRFQANYGREPLDAIALAACANAAPRLAGLSVERIWSELRKLLAAPDPAPTVDAMRGFRVLAAALPEAGPVSLKPLVELEHSLGRPPGTMRRLAALVLRDRVPALIARLKLSKAEAKQLVATVAMAAMPSTPVQTLLRRYGADAVTDGALVAAAVHGLPRQLMMPFLLAAAAWEDPQLPIGGADLVAMGVAPGPDVGRHLKRLEEWWEEGGCRADRDDLLREAKRLLSVPPLQGGG